MKNILIILLTFSLSSSYSQKIQSKIFDKFDSVYTITTGDEALSGKILRGKYMYASISFHSYKKATFINLPNANYFSVLIGFVTNRVTTIDKKTEIKIEFVDGTFGTYNNPDLEYQIVTDMGFVNFHVSPKDKLFTTNVKTIRIATSDDNIDYDISSKKSSVIKEALVLVKTESEK
jgi:hypothetical protein